MQTLMNQLMDNKMELMFAVINVADAKQKEYLLPLIKDKMMHFGKHSRKGNQKKNKKNKCSK